MNGFNCVYCGSELTHFVGTQKEYIEDKVITIINTPLVICNGCKEEYIMPEIMRVINNIVLTIAENIEEKNITVNFNEYIEKNNDSKKQNKVLSN